jgi:hypothetical protein
LQAGYEYKRGELGLFQLSPGTTPDPAYSPTLPDLVETGDWVLTDLGYFKVKTFRQYHAKDAFFLSRFLVRTTVHCAETLAVIDLGTVLQHFAGNTLELQVVMGKDPDEQTPCRLICMRVSAQVANERRRKLLQAAKKKRRTVGIRELGFAA